MRIAQVKKDSLLPDSSPYSRLMFDIALILVIILGSIFSRYPLSSFKVRPDLSNKFCFDILDTPTSNSHKQEQEFRKIRESKINFIQFKNNDIEGMVYDFMIGNKKIQEKRNV